MRGRESWWGRITKLRVLEDDIYEPTTLWANSVNIFTMLGRCEEPPVISPYEAQTGSPEQAAYMASPVNELWVQKNSVSQNSVSNSDLHIHAHTSAHMHVYTYLHCHILYYTSEDTYPLHMHIVCIHTHMHK